MIQIKPKKMLMIACFLLLCDCVAIVFGARNLLKTWKAKIRYIAPQKDVSCCY